MAMGERERDIHKHDIYIYYIDKYIYIYIDIYVFLNIYKIYIFVDIYTDILRYTWWNFMHACITDYRCITMMFFSFIGTYYMVHVSWFTRRPLTAHRAWRGQVAPYLWTQQQVVATHEYWKKNWTQTTGVLGSSSSLRFFYVCLCKYVHIFEANRIEQRHPRTWS